MIIRFAQIKDLEIISLYDEHIKTSEFILSVTDKARKKYGNRYA